MGRFCLFSFIFQLPFYTLVFSEWGCFFLLVRLGRGDTKDFLSLSKKVLVTLIYVICSFFSAARRTNQEAPPQLSGFWLVATVAVGVCGTRSAQTVLALFPPSSLRLRRPIKAESGGSSLYSNPLALWAFPLYSLTETPRKATGHGRGEVGSSLFFFFLGYSRNENRCI